MQRGGLLLKPRFTLTLGALLLAACGGGSGGGPGGGAQNSVAPPMLGIVDAVVSETDSGTALMSFRLVLSRSISEDVSVDYTSNGISATATEDFVGRSGRMDIPAGDTEADIEIEVNGDNCFEDDETIELVLSGISSNATLGDATAIGTITNDDQKRIISIDDTAAAEGDSGFTKMEFTVHLDRASCYDTAADFTSNMVTADALDFVVAGGSLMIPAGDTQTTVEVEVYGDTDFEADETLSVNLENVSDHVDEGDVDAFGSLLNDDAPVLSLSSPVAAEGDAGDVGSLTFFLTLEAPTDEISVDYFTSDGSATESDPDYIGAAGTLVIPAGQTSASVDITVLGDDRDEPDETVQFQLANLVGNAQLPLAITSGRILDDDEAAGPAEGVTVGAGQVTEGDSGSSNEMVFQVSIDPAPASAVTVSYATANGSAEAGSDYVGESGNVVIPAGNTTAQISITVNGDDDVESDETFTVDITGVGFGNTLLTPFATGRIIDDDGPGGLPRLNVGSASTVEGNDNETTTLVFDVMLSAPAVDVVTVDYTTRPDTALAGSDYVPASGSLDFPVGITSRQVEVTVNGDTLVEATETMNLQLSNIGGSATLNDASGTGTIVTDDPFARIRIDNDVVIEGDSGTVDLAFTVTLSVPAADPVSVDFETLDDTTDVTDDYTYNAGTLVIPAGDTESTITVSVNGDTDTENDEKLLVALSNPSPNAEIQDAQGDGVISNDDGDGGWGTPELLEQDPDHDARYPEIAMDPGGNALAIFPQEEAFPARTDIVSRRYVAGSGWDASLQDVSDSGSISASNLGQRPQIAMDDNGNAIAAWEDSSGFPDYIPQIVANHYEAGAGWGTPVVLYEGTYADGYWVKVNVNPAGQAVVTWLAENATTPVYDDVWAIKFDPVAGWDLQATQLEFNTTQVDSFPQSAIDDAGNVIVVWARHQIGSCCDRDVYMTRYDAADDLWSTPATVENDIEDAGAARVAMRGNGDAVVLWEQRWSGGPRVMARFFSAAIEDWTGPAVTIGDGGSFTSVDIDLAYNSDGDVFASWMSASGAATFESSVWAARYDADANGGTGAWNAARMLESDEVNSAYSARLAVDLLGNAIVVWYQGVDGTLDTTYNVRAARFDAVADAWQPAESIEVTGPSNDGTSYDPKIAMDAAGNAIVVWYRNKWNDLWQSYRAGVPDVWAVRYTRP